MTSLIFFHFSADSHLLHLFITGLKAVTLSPCTVPQVSLRSDDCVSALPLENPAHPSENKSKKLTSSTSWQKVPHHFVTHKLCLWTQKWKVLLYLCTLMCSKQYACGSLWKDKHQCYLLCETQQVKDRHTFNGGVLTCVWECSIGWTVKLEALGTIAASAIDLWVQGRAL